MMKESTLCDFKFLKFKTSLFCGRTKWYIRVIPGDYKDPETGGLDEVCVLNYKKYK